MITLCQALQEKFSGPQSFDQVLAMNGKIYRNFKGRKTLRFEHAGQGYFLKIHPGVGWREILKTLLKFKIPVLSAKDEYQAIRALQVIGVETMTIAGYGCRGSNPANMHSFLITEEIKDAVSLEELMLQWRRQKPDPRMKRALIRKVAEMARKMHRNGVNHRDFYICHFLLSRSWLETENCENPPLYIIDLHRSQVRSQVPRRWIEKDLAGLHFSSMDAGLTRRDRLRFIACYEDRPLRQAVNAMSGFWRKIDRMAIRLYRKFQKHMAKRAQ